MRRLAAFSLICLLALTLEARPQGLLKIVTYARTIVALPAGRAFTFGVITGVAGNYATKGIDAAYDALLHGLAPTPVPPPPTEPTPQTQPPQTGGAGSNAPGGLVQLPKGCALAGCNSFDSLLFALDKNRVTLPDDILTKMLPPSSPSSDSPAPNAPPPLAVKPPPPPPDCRDDGLDGREALRRAVPLDNGTGFAARNAPAAERCYYLAAQQNIPIAQYDLADMLLAGDVGVPADPGRGMQYLEAAARNGFVPAQVRLAIACEHGDHVAIDLRRAGYWYTEAANAGDAYAQYQLSRFYYEGAGGVHPDYFKAFWWLNLALRENYPPAPGTMDALLDKVSRDADAGEAGAQYIMGVAYEVGVPGLIRPDPRRARAAYEDAGAMDDLQRLCGQYPGACN